MQKRLDWNFHIRNFGNYLRLERGLADNSVVSYVRDVQKLMQHVTMSTQNSSPIDVQPLDIQAFIAHINSLGMSAFSQARIVSGIKAFYRYLLFEELLKKDPTVQIVAPKLARKLPDTLHYHEIEKLLNAIDLSSPEGMRNRALIEVLYSSGLRVSELVNLMIYNVHFDNGFLHVTGKGDKERLVPIGRSALKYVRLYKEEVRVHIPVQKGFESYLFLNRRGKKLTRTMVFTIVKQLVAKIGLHKTISPHTFRHSFATHMIEGGADLRVVQEILGHESITTTEVYTHLKKAYLQQVIQEFHPRS